MMDALTYHEITKHSPESVRRAGGLDFSNQPRLFKKYVGLGSVPVPASLADLIHLSGGITKWLHGMPFRANACTGALYHIEMYLVTGDLDGLGAGVYHVDVAGDTLVPLRSGDFRATLSSAAGRPDSLNQARFALVFTSAFWRNAWKYRARTYRHAFWDLGTMLANTLAVAGAEGDEPEVLVAFADDQVNVLLGLDPGREAALAIVPLRRGREPLPASPGAAPLTLEVEPYSRREIDYPEIAATHRASNLASGDQAAAWRGRPSGNQPPGPPASEDAGPATPPGENAVLSLPAAAPIDLSRTALPEVIRRRGSARQFAPAPVSFSQLSAILQFALAPIPADFGPIVNLYLIAHAVEGLDAGAYLVQRESLSLRVIRDGDLRHQAGFLALGQSLAAEAALNLYSLADLRQVIDQLGNRGYRAAQLEGGIIGGRVYLAAYALGLGATGLTFFDDHVTDLLAPAVRKSVMFLSAIGHPYRRRHLL